MNGNVSSPVNLGNPQQLSIKELAFKIKEMTKSQSTINLLELPQDDPLIREPDISKAKKMIDWEPKVDLDCGLKKTIDYFEHLQV